jgi:hypothetical protein
MVALTVGSNWVPIFKKFWIPKLDGKPSTLGACISKDESLAVLVVADWVDVAFSFMVTVMISPTFAALSSPNKKFPGVFPGQSAPSSDFICVGLAYKFLGIIVDLVSTALWVVVEQPTNENNKISDIAIINLLTKN